jgi:hypothetical protein
LPIYENSSDLLGNSNSNNNAERITLTQLVLSAQIATLATHSSQFVLLKQNYAGSIAPALVGSSNSEAAAVSAPTSNLSRLQSQISTYSNKQVLLLEELAAISELPFLTQLNVFFFVATILFRFFFII